MSDVQRTHHFSRTAEALNLHWESAFPCCLQDADFKLIDVNAAYLSFTGYRSEQLLGHDPVLMFPEADRALQLVWRQQWMERVQRGMPALLTEHRLLDADGRERWFRVSMQVLMDPRAGTAYLSVLQDSTAEHVARERADRSALELDDWFGLSPVGMVLFDESGLLVRTNPAFEALVGNAPALMSQASGALQELLAWVPDVANAGMGTSIGNTSGGAPSAQLQVGGKPVVSRGWLPDLHGGQRRMQATVRCYLTTLGQRRFMGVVEDRSMEEERDLAQVQIGALMQTAGVGLATFAETTGWVRQRAAGSASTDVAPSAAPPKGSQVRTQTDNRADAKAAVQAIGREMVLPSSMPEYERLQNALRTDTGAEVRYAISHPELGERWLLTRVEPARLASGKRTTSVVTLDITEQQQAQRRSEQLLFEMSTILESGSAGIAYLRGDVLVRCNRRFQAMLGMRRRVPTGSSLAALFGHDARSQGVAAATLQALAEGTVFETEFEVPRTKITSAAAKQSLGSSRWYALSVRRTGVRSEQVEAIAVLSDVTRLKTQQMELEVLARDRELMFSLSGVGIAFLRKGCIQRANEAFASLSGHSAADLVGMTTAATFSDIADFETCNAVEEASLRVSGRWDGERYLRRADGRLLWVQVSMRLVHQGDLSGGIIASYVNVDDRHRAEQAVALQAERTRAILDSVLVGIVTVGPGGIEWMNSSARRMFGGELADFLDQPISTVATPEADHPFRQTQYIDELADEPAKGRTETFECRVKARDGREFWVVGNAVATGYEGIGRQLTYALLDIERRRSAEARIAEAQASLQRIIEAAPMAITLRDARTLRIVQANAVAADIAGLSIEGMIGRTPEDLFSPEVAAERRADMQTALLSSEVTQREYRAESDGEVLVWDARYLPMSAPGQEPDTLLLVATDVTEQRAAQEAKFDAAMAQRDMLVKEVHHRIKNNLQGVAGLLQQIGVRRPEVAELMAEVVGQVHAIAEVYGLQVGASASTDGALRGPLRSVSVVEAIAASVQRTFGRDIVFTVQGEQAPWWVFPEAESIPIALTLNELLTNAVKHCTGSSGLDGGAGVAVGTVTCTLVCGEATVRVLIANTGRLPEGFNLARFPGGVSGLGLVRALLPRRSASLTLEQDGPRVLATVTLGSPGVLKLKPE